MSDEVSVDQLLDASYERGVNVGSFAMVAGLKAMIEDGSDFGAIRTEVVSMFEYLSEVLPESIRDSLIEAATTFVADEENAD
jgi:hypothetical protein